MTQFRLWSGVLLGMLLGSMAMVSAAAEMPLMGGVGGAYFLAEPGPLTIDVSKLNVGTPAELRLFLVGPDRRPLDEKTIPSGSSGQLQTVRLSTQVVRKGVYALLVVASDDRYGTRIAWSFTTNCARYLIETARGHKDAAHSEPIIFFSPTLPASICFQPPSDAFLIDATGLASGVTQLSLLDANGGLVQSLPVSGGQVHATIGSGIPRTALPWRLHLTKASGTIEIDGLTRWRTQDPYPDLTLWTSEPNAWFELLPNRWLVSPYGRKVNGSPGAAGEVSFKIQNNAPTQRTFALALEPGSGTLAASLAAS